MFSPLMGVAAIARAVREPSMSKPGVGKN